MLFLPEPWLPSLPAIPDVPAHEFMFDENYGRASYGTSLDPFVCAISHKKITAQQQKKRVEYLARGLSFDLQWPVNGLSELEKVIGVFALNTIDVPTVTWAAHRLGGVCCPINASYTSAEVATLLKMGGAKALFTVSPLLSVAKAAAEAANIPSKRIYVLPMPNEPEGEIDHVSFAELLERGENLGELEPLHWPQGEAERRVAFLSHSSGTSGPPKMAAVSHRNIISNVMQLTAFDLEARKASSSHQVVLGVLPSSHVYGVVVISALSTYRGDSVIVLPRFDLEEVLATTQKFKINVLTIVPPILMAMSKQPHLLQNYDLSSVKVVLSGGSPLDKATISPLQSQYPQWIFRNAYGLTEMTGCATMTHYYETWPGSSGMIIPGNTLKLVSEDGSEVSEYEQPGEVYVKSPSVILGYWQDAKATAETFVDQEDGRWLRTGDIALFRQSPRGDPHIFIIDRVKELIKVNSLQVSPAELESCLLNHPAVQDCAVTSIPDERAGELPKAYVQRSPQASSQISDHNLRNELIALVQRDKARHKRLAGGIEFIPAIPRSPAGKILRRLLNVKVDKAKL